MASQTVHYRQIVAGPDAENKLQIAMKSSPHKYDSKKGVGFLLSPIQNLTSFSSRLVFPKTIKAKKVDTNDLTSQEFLTEEWAVNFATDIEYDFKRKVAMVTGSRSGFKVIEQKLGEIESVNLHFADLDVDIVAMLREFQKNYKKTLVQTISVKNYVDSAAYTTNGNFKADPKAAQTDEFINKYKDKIIAIQLQILQPSEVYSLKFTKKGSVTFSAKGKDGEWPDHLYGYTADLLMHFNKLKITKPEDEEPEVEGEKPSSLKLVGSDAA
jgi:hypothetical protein